MRGFRSSPTRATCRSRSRSPTTAPAPRTWTSRAARSSRGSFQAYDQTYLLDALEQLGEGFVGVANVPPDITDREVLALYAGGVRAYRVNLFRGGDLDAGRARRALRRARAAGTSRSTSTATTCPSWRRGWRSVPRLVIDHLGMSRPARGPAPRRGRRLREGHAASAASATTTSPRRCARSPTSTRPRCCSAPTFPRHARQRAVPGRGPASSCATSPGQRALFANAAAVYR